ncbi:hypothetical protein [Nocardia sp. XZ_19_369]|uniref:hypothetical protein n=1 Tax=Nocardia sp. XZ_19_369 TaxID=2769487 RepID=UPI00188F3808|nr:hypothetical protein [Nocardia sp. XZ_19_369]
MSDDWFDDPTDPPAPSLSVVSSGDDEDWFTASPVDPAPQTGAPPPARLRRRPRLRAPSIAFAAAVTTVAGAAIALALVLVPTDTPPAASLSPAVAAPPPVSTSTTPWCADLAGGEPISVTSPDRGMAAIAAFEQAYYGRRNAAAARAHVAPDARVGTVEELAAGIATVPAGTTHCVLAQQIQPGIYAVDLFARLGGARLDRYPQTITTIDAADAPSGALITSILPREAK